MGKRKNIWFGTGVPLITVSWPKLALYKFFIVIVIVNAEKAF